MAYSLALNVRRLKQREYLKTLHNDLHSLELYYKEGRTVKLLATSHDAAFFGEEQWSYYQQKASKYLKKKVKLGKSKNFKLGKEKQQLNCAIIAWPNGLAAISITSRSLNLEMTHLEAGINEAAKLSEKKFLSTYIDVSSRKKLPSHWANESQHRVLNEDRKLRKQSEILNRFFQDELVHVGNEVTDFRPKRKKNQNIFVKCVTSFVDE